MKSSMQGCRKWGAGADYAHHSTTCPAGFSDLATALDYVTLSNQQDQVVKVLIFFYIEKRSEQSDEPVSFCRFFCFLKRSSLPSIFKY